MLDLIRNLPSGATVLDLGAGSGSFPLERSDLTVVRLDLEKPHRTGSGSYVIADAARMPFRPAAFDLVVSNHSLEHFPALEDTLKEMGRVLKPGSAIYIAVPDAGTVTDRIYRWLGRGGGHVNPFYTPEQVAELVTRHTGSPLRSTTVLFSAFSFLNSHNFTAPPPRRIAFFAFGNEKFLAVMVALAKTIDRRFGSRFSQYGWAFRFGGPGDTEPPEVWINVCVRCGSGHSAAFLKKKASQFRVAGIWDAYLCPSCGGFNFQAAEIKARRERYPTALPK